MVHQDEIHVSTSLHGELTRIDGDIERIVQRSGVQAGIVHVFNIGSTGAITMLEFEPGLQRDFPELLDRLVPPSRDYGHELAWHDGNGHSHLQASMLGPDITVPVSEGRLNLGTWQQIVHVECDVKPRKRTLVVTVLGDTQDG